MAFEFKNNTKNLADAEAWNSVGKMVASEIGVGLSENSYLAITALENVYVELETLTKNAAKNAENLAKKRQKRELENLKTAKELELLTEREYYEKLKKYRDENLRQGTDAWFKCTEEIAAYNKRLLKEQEELQQEMAEKILKLQKELANKLKSDEPWITEEKVTFKGMGKNGTDLVYSETSIEDFREEIQLLENFRDRIIELKNLGNIPDGVFSEIAKMDIKDGLKVASYLLSADADTRKRFIDGYNSHEALADSAAWQLNGILNGQTLKNEGIYSAEKFTSGFAGGNKETAAIFISTLEESFDEIPEGYYHLGSRAADAFGNGFLDKIPQIMEDARSYMAAQMQSIADSISAVMNTMIKSNASGSVANYTNNFTFNASKDTTTEQLAAARNAATLSRLRGGN